jgi:hypothetical protein
VALASSASAGSLSVSHKWDPGYLWFRVTWLSSSASNVSFAPADGATGDAIGESAGASASNISFAPADGATGDAIGESAGA